MSGDKTSITLFKRTLDILRERKPSGVTWDRWLLELSGGVPDDWEQ